MKDRNQQIVSMLEIKRTARGPVLEVLGNWLVGEAKSLWPRRAGWRFWEKTNVARTWVLVSYHHPAIIVWSWSIWVRFLPSTPTKQALRPWRWLMWKPEHRLRDFTIPWLIRISFHEQFSSTWMLSSEGEQRLRAHCFHDEQESTVATAAVQP